MVVGPHILHVYITGHDNRFVVQSCEKTIIIVKAISTTQGGFSSYLQGGVDVGVVVGRGGH